MRALVGRKLGACARCMRASLALTISSWMAVGVVLAVGAPAGAEAVALGFAAACTALFTAHVVAFFTRSARWWRLEAATRTEDPDARSRRAFLTVSVTLLGAALLAPVLRALGGEAVARKSVQDINCKTGPHWRIDLTAPLIVGCGAASPGRTPGENALADFLGKVRAACRAAEPQQNKKGVCEQRRCPRVQDDCDVRRAAGADFRDEDLTLRPKQPGDPCGPAATHVLFFTKRNGRYHCRCDCE
jgi:hypothetical protein